MTQAQNEAQGAVVYGIPNCDTVKKARTWLQDQGIAFTFHDFKKQGLTAELVTTWARQVPIDQLLNRRGTTWRTLSPEQQASADDDLAAARLMAANPSLVKRPVVVWPWGQTTVGFKADTWGDLLAAKR